jgi:hypothetical protein
MWGTAGKIKRSDVQNSYNDIKSVVSSLIEDDVLNKILQYVANNSIRPSLVSLQTSITLTRRRHRI